jgi:hypothetical protein
MDSIERFLSTLLLSISAWDFAGLLLYRGAYTDALVWKLVALENAYQMARVESKCLNSNTDDPKQRGLLERTNKLRVHMRTTCVNTSDTTTMTS